MRKNFGRFTALLLVLMLAFAVTGCGKKEETNSLDRQRVRFTMEDGQNFVIETYPEYAPETCANFVQLVSDGFYNGIKFHRVLDNFVAQAGDPNGDGTGGSEKTIKGEFADNGFDQNTLSHTRGVVSMARRGNDMDSASSQFFICYEDVTNLDGQYAAFGKVIEGMDVVDGFLKVPRSASGMPAQDIIIQKAEVE